MSDTVNTSVTYLLTLKCGALKQVPPSAYSWDE